MGNSLFPEKDYIGLGDGPIDWAPPDQGFGSAFGAAVDTGLNTSPVIGTTKFLSKVPPRALDKWVPPIGQDQVHPLYTVSDPEAVAAKGDKLFQTEKDLKAYPGYNETIPFEPGMTQSRYDALVELRTDALRREAATAGHPFVNVFGQMVGGAPDPSNWIPILGELGTAWKMGKGARLGWNMVKSGTEASIGSTLATAAVSGKEKAIGNDMSLKAWVETASMGFLIGAVFGPLRSVPDFLNTGTVKQAAASRTIVESPLTPESAPDAVAVLADAYDSFMVNHGLAQPFFAGGKGGPIEFGSHSQEAMTKGMQTAQRSIDLNWASAVFHRKNEMEPLPMLNMQEKLKMLEDIKTVDSKGHAQLLKELNDYNTIEVDQRVVTHIIDDPAIKERLKDSKVRDATGRPITLFVGTPYGTDTPLSMSKAGKNVGGESAKMTLWATDNPHDASGYSLSNYFEKEDFNANNAGDGEEHLIIDEKPNVRPILLDMKNPLIVDYKGKGYDEFRHVDTINEAKRKGHDGVIFKNIVDTPHLLYDVKNTDMKLLFNKAQTPSTHYAIFDPKQIVDMQDVSTDFGKVIDAQQAYIDARAKAQSSIVETSNMKSPAITGYDFGVQKGYNYDSQVAAAEVSTDVASNKFIDVLPLLKLAAGDEEVKYQEASNKAAGLDIEAKTTGFEDDVEMAFAKDPQRPEEVAQAMKVDEDIAKADKLEEFMNAAVQCIE